MSKKSLNEGDKITRILKPLFVRWWRRFSLFLLPSSIYPSSSFLFPLFFCFFSISISISTSISFFVVFPLLLVVVNCFQFGFSFYCFVIVQLAVGCWLLAIGCWLILWNSTRVALGKAAGAGRRRIGGRNDSGSGCSGRCCCNVRSMQR